MCNFTISNLPLTANLFIYTVLSSVFIVQVYLLS